MSPAHDESAEAFRQKLSGLHQGTVRVVDAQVTLEHIEEARPLLIVLLTLEAPPTGRDTWPIKDVDQVEKQVRQLASETNGLPDRLVVSLKSNGDPGVSDEDEASPEEGLGAALNRRSQEPQ